MEKRINMNKSIITITEDGNQLTTQFSAADTSDFSHLALLSSIVLVTEMISRSPVDAGELMKTLVVLAEKQKFEGKNVNNLLYLLDQLGTATSANDLEVKTR